MNLMWLSQDWLDGRPSRGGDEMYRHTVVLPLPWTRHTVVVDEDEPSENAWRALVVVVAPWWACRSVRHADYRRWVRWERAVNRHLYQRWDDLDDEEIDQMLGALEEVRPPLPQCFNVKEKGMAGRGFEKDVFHGDLPEPEEPPVLPTPRDECRLVLMRGRFPEGPIMTVAASATVGSREALDPDERARMRNIAMVEMQKHPLLPWEQMVLFWQETVLGDGPMDDSQDAPPSEEYMLSREATEDALRRSREVDLDAAIQVDPPLLTPAEETTEERILVAMAPPSFALGEEWGEIKAAMDRFENDLVYDVHAENVGLVYQRAANLDNPLGAVYAVLSRVRENQPEGTIEMRLLLIPHEYDLDDPHDDIED